MFIEYLLWCHEDFLWVNSFTLCHNCLKITIIFTQHMREMRHKEVKTPGQGHMVNDGFRIHTRSGSRVHTVSPLTVSVLPTQPQGSASLQRSWCLFPLVTHSGLGLKGVDIKGPTARNTCICMYSFHENPKLEENLGKAPALHIWGLKVSGRKDTHILSLGV